MNFWGSGIWDEVRLIIPIETFDAMYKSDITFAELQKGLEEWQDWRNKTLQINIGNSTQFISCGDNLFAFSVHKDEFYIWNERGSTSVLSCRIDGNNTPSKDFIDRLYEKLNDYNNGVFTCSDCGAKITSVAGRYFSGIYCKDCWKRKWKAVESAETYE